MFLGYLGVVLFSILSIFYNKLFIAIFISAIIFATGFALDASFIKNNQDERCKAVRANPTCIEDACGFNCSNSINDESATVCKDKDLNLCKSFRDGQIKF